MKTGTVLSIDRCSMQDGPGIRTTVFLKGCPLRCLWCHNPESQGPDPVLYSLYEKCTACGACISVCPHDCHFRNDERTVAINRDKCEVCGACVQVCPNNALEIKGRTMTAEEVLAVVEKDKAYYESSCGGMTVSGGEPLFQWEFTLELLRGAKQAGIHTCVETSGFGKTGHVQEIAEFCDLFYYDVKETDPEKHREFTGVDNTLILKNLRMLDSMGKEIVLRCPLVPELNAREDHLRGIAELADSLDYVTAIHPLGYHPMGAVKNIRIGEHETMDDVCLVEEDQLETWADIIRRRTDVPVLTGFE